MGLLDKIKKAFPTPLLTGSLLALFLTSACQSTPSDSRVTDENHRDAVEKFYAEHPVTFLNEYWLAVGSISDRGTFAGTGPSLNVAQERARGVCEIFQPLPANKRMCRNAAHWDVYGPDKSDWAPTFIGYFGYTHGHKTNTCIALGFDGFEAGPQKCFQNFKRP